MKKFAEIFSRAGEDEQIAAHSQEVDQICAALRQARQFRGSQISGSSHIFVYLMRNASKASRIAAGAAAPLLRGAAEG